MDAEGVSVGADDAVCVLAEQKQEPDQAPGDLMTHDRQGSRQHEEADLEDHLTAALAHVVADTALLPALVLQQVDLLQQVCFCPSARAGLSVTLCRCTCFDKSVLSARSWLAVDDGTM